MAGGEARLLEQSSVRGELDARAAQWERVWHAPGEACGTVELGAQLELAQLARKEALLQHEPFDSMHFVQLLHQ